MLPEAPSQPNAGDIRFESYLPVLTIPLDHPFLAGPSKWPPAPHTLAASLGVCKFLSGDWQNTRSRTRPLTLWLERGLKTSLPSQIGIFREVGGYSQGDVSESAADRCGTYTNSIPSAVPADCVSLIGVPLIGRPVEAK